MNKRLKQILTSSIALMLSFCVGVLNINAFKFTLSQRANNFLIGLVGEPARVSCEVEEDIEEFFDFNMPFDISHREIKSNITVKNTGNVDAYVKLTVNAEWVDENGTSYPTLACIPGYFIVSKEYWTGSYGQQEIGETIDLSDPDYYLSDVTDILIMGWDYTYVAEATPNGQPLVYGTWLDALPEDGGFNALTYDDYQNDRRNALSMLAYQYDLETQETETVTNYDTESWSNGCSFYAMLSDNYLASDFCEGNYKRTYCLYDTRGYAGQAIMPHGEIIEYSTVYWPNCYSPYWTNSVMSFEDDYTADLQSAYSTGELFNLNTFWYTGAIAPGESAPILFDDVLADQKMYIDLDADGIAETELSLKLSFNAEAVAVDDVEEVWHCTIDQYGTILRDFYAIRNGY